MLAWVLGGCASVYKPQNVPLDKVEPNAGYRLFSVPKLYTGNHPVALSFSGGGTRAAALTYGVQVSRCSAEYRFPSNLRGCAEADSSSVPSLVEYHTSPRTIQTLTPKKGEVYLIRTLDDRGLSIREAERLTGVAHSKRQARTLHPGSDDYHPRKA